jgi:hypothetical protein
MITRNNLNQYQSSFNNYMRKTPAANYLYKNMSRATKESFGWMYEDGVNKGFLGLKGSPLSRGVGLKGMAKTAGSLSMRSIPLLANIYFAYSGYKEGGIWGAIKGTGENIAATMAWNVGMDVLGVGANAAFIAAPFVAAGAGYYALGEASNKKLAKSRKVNMVSDVVDRFGTMATMRQRSLAMIQNSHLNGRITLGNEALLVHL